MRSRAVKKSSFFQTRSASTQGVIFTNDLYPTQASLEPELRLRGNFQIETLCTLDVLLSQHVSTKLCCVSPYVSIFYSKNLFCVLLYIYFSLGLKVCLEPYFYPLFKIMIKSRLGMFSTAKIRCYHFSLRIIIAKLTEIIHRIRDVCDGKRSNVWKK